MFWQVFSMSSTQATGETNIPQNPRVGTKRYMAPEILDMTWAQNFWMKGKWKIIWRISGWTWQALSPSVEWMFTALPWWCGRPWGDAWHMMVLRSVALLMMMRMFITVQWWLWWRWQWKRWQRFLLRILRCHSTTWSSQIPASRTCTRYKDAKILWLLDFWRKKQFSWKFMQNCFSGCVCWLL